jgi:hypothetical protein
MIRTRLCTQTSAATLHFIDMLQKTGFNAIIWCNFYLLRGSQCFMQAFVAHKCIEFLINHQKQEGYWTYNIDVYDEIIFSSPTINISESLSAWMQLTTQKIFSPLYKYLTRILEGSLIPCVRWLEKFKFIRHTLLLDLQAQ